MSTDDWTIVLVLSIIIVAMLYTGYKYGMAGYADDSIYTFTETKEGEDDDVCN